MENELKLKQEQILMKRGDADFLAYMLLKRIMNSVDNKPKAFSKLLEDCGEDAEDIIQEWEEINADREKYNDMFLNSLREMQMNALIVKAKEIDKNA